MNVRPVIARELRAQARQGFTYWLRVWGGAALLQLFLALPFAEALQRRLRRRAFSWERMGH